MMKNCHGIHTGMASIGNMDSMGSHFSLDNLRFQTLFSLTPRMQIVEKRRKR